MMTTALWVVAGALGLALGMPNPLWQGPLLALVFPLALVRLGWGDGGVVPRRWSAVRRGWLCGALGWVCVLYWIAVPVHEFGMLPWLLALPCPVLLGLYMGVYGGAFALCARELAVLRAPSWVAALVLGLGWYLLEWLRGWLFTGFAWAPLSAAFVPWPALLQGASVLGAYGLSGLFAGLAALVGLGLSQGLRRGLLLTGVAAAGFAALWAGGWSVLDGAPAEGTGGVDVVLVQGNLNQNVIWEPGMQRATIERYLTLSRGALDALPQDRGAALLVWPETSMPFDMERAPGFVAPLRALCRLERADLVTGSIGMDAVTRKYLNRAYLILADGTDGGLYEKEHLVPFGEYTPPFLDLPFLRPLLQGVGTFAPGRATAPFVLSRSASEGGLVPGLLICYESLFPELARARVRDGANVLVNISNDAWFGRTSAPWQHLHAAVLRAVEYGRPLVRSTNTGVSAFVDSRGRVVMHSGLFVATTLHARVAPGTETTVFYRLAPWLPGCALAVCGALCVYVVRRRARRERFSA